MDKDKETRTFFFDGGPVGYFLEDRLPSTAGSYRYIPYRSVFHYRLQQALVTKGPQQCHFLVGETKRRFTVLVCPSYGVLELDEVTTE